MWNFCFQILIGPACYLSHASNSNDRLDGKGGFIQPVVQPAQGQKAAAAENLVMAM
jgi:hypothetical protein